MKMIKQAWLLLLTTSLFAQEQPWQERVAQLIPTLALNAQAAYLLQQAQNNPRLYIPALISGFLGAYLSVTLFKKSAPKPSVQPQPQIAVLHLEGEMRDFTTFLNKLEECQLNKHIAGIMVFINSGGGSGSFGEMAYEFLQRAAQEKPLIIYVEGMCCSAAYHAACAGTIIAAPGSLVGNIGTWLPIERHSEVTFERNGEKGNVKKMIFSRGKYKVWWHPNTPDLTEEQIEHINEELDAHYEEFCTHVAQARNLNIEFIKDTEARTYNPTKALAMGLIDAIGTRADAFALLKELMLTRNTTINADFCLEENLVHY